MTIPSWFTRKNLLSRVLLALPWIGIALVSAFYLSIIWVRYINLRNGIDLGTYNQVLYNIISGNSFPPFNTILGKIAWGDHAHFIMVLLAPLYGIFPHYFTLPVIQLVAITTSGWALYSIAHSYFRNYLYSYAILFSYLFFFGVQYAIDFDFHANVLTASLLAWMIWAYHYKYWPLYWVVLPLVLITREDAPLFCASFGLYLLLFQPFFIRPPKKIWHPVKTVGLVTLSISLIYFGIVVYVVMPLWEPNHIPLAYFDVDTQSKNPIRIVLSLVGDPVRIIQNMFDSSVKVRTMKNLFGSFSYVPLLSPFTYLAATPNFIARFLSGEQQRWDMKLHYSASLVSILSYGTILGTAFVGRLIARIPRIHPTRAMYIVSSGIGISLFISTYIVSMRDIDLPIYRFTNDAYTRDADVLDYGRETLSLIVRMIPEHDSVSASSSLVPALSSREHIYYYPNPLPQETDWVVLTNTYVSWPLSRAEINTAINEYRNNPRYEQVWSLRNMFVFRKIQNI